MTYLFTKYDSEERVLDHRITVRLVQQIVVLPCVASAAHERQSRRTKNRKPPTARPSQHPAPALYYLFYYRLTRTAGGSLRHVSDGSDPKTIAQQGKVCCTAGF